MFLKHDAFLTLKDGGSDMAIWEGCSAAEVLRDVVLRSLNKGAKTPEEIAAETTVNGAQPRVGNVERICGYLAANDVVRCVPDGKYELLDTRLALPHRSNAEREWFNRQPRRVRNAAIGDPKVELFYGGIVD